MLITPALLVEWSTESFVLAWRCWSFAYLLQLKGDNAGLTSRMCQSTHLSFWLAVHHPGLVRTVLWKPIWRARWITCCAYNTKFVFNLPTSIEFWRLFQEIKLLWQRICIDWHLMTSSLLQRLKGLKIMLCTLILLRLIKSDLFIHLSSNLLTLLLSPPSSPPPSLLNSYVLAVCFLEGIIRPSHSVS